MSTAVEERREPDDQCSTWPSRRTDSAYRQRMPTISRHQRARRGCAHDPEDRNTTIELPSTSGATGPSFPEYCCARDGARRPPRRERPRSTQTEAARRVIRARPLLHYCDLDLVARTSAHNMPCSPSTSWWQASKSDFSSSSICTARFRCSRTSRPDGAASERLPHSAGGGCPTVHLNPSDQRDPERGRHYECEGGIPCLRPAALVGCCRESAVGRRLAR